jgi:hypothetical protein
MPIMKFRICFQAALGVLMSLSAFAQQKPAEPRVPQPIPLFFREVWRDTAAIPVTQAAVWIGDPEQGRYCLDHIFSLCNPVGITRRTLPFLELQTMADGEFPHGRRYYTKSGYFKSLSDRTIDVMVESLATVPSPATQIELAYLGGAASKVGATETAFGDRSSPYVLNLLGNWSEKSEDAANVFWVRNLFQSVRPAMTPGVYINFMSEDEDDRVREAYMERWERLMTVKSRYDPGNFFRLNQNIPPEKTTLETGHVRGK